MRVYHITDLERLPSIIQEGLIGQPILYVATSPQACRAIRRSQEQRYERRWDVGTVIFTFVLNEQEDLWVDPNCTFHQGQPVAFMLYADIARERLTIFNDRTIGHYNAIHNTTQ